MRSCALVRAGGSFARLRGAGAVARGPAPRSASNPDGSSSDSSVPSRSAARRSLSPAAAACTVRCTVRSTAGETDNSASRSALSAAVSRRASAARCSPIAVRRSSPAPVPRACILRILSVVSMSAATSSWLRRATWFAAHSAAVGRRSPRTRFAPSSSPSSRSCFASALRAAVNSAGGFANSSPSSPAFMPRTSRRSPGCAIVPMASPSAPTPRAAAAAARRAARR